MSTTAVRNVRLAVLVVSLGSVIAVVFLNPAFVTFQSFSAGEFAQKVTALFMVALFVERALEVFVSAWRDRESATRELDAEETHRRARASGQYELHAEEVSSKRKELSSYKAETRRIAFFTGIGMGIVVSAVGIRALELFVDAQAFDALSRTQQSVFGAVDVVLTGALIGGGADGLHKLVSVFTNFMDTTAAKYKAPGAT